MSLQETEAIIIRSDPIGEADKLITFYSPVFGKIRGVAQGARRPKSRFGSTLELLTHIQLVFFAKKNTGLHRVSQTDLVEYFPNLRQELSQLTAAIYLVDVIYSLTEQEDNNSDLFILLLYTLQLLNEGKDPFGLLRIFEVRALTLLGYAPQLEFCVFCQKKLDLAQRIVYTINNGGLMCHDCAKLKTGFAISRGSVSFLKQATKVALSKISHLKLSSTQAQELQKVLHQHMRYHLKQEIKSYQFLEQL